MSEKHTCWQEGECCCFGDKKRDTSLDCSKCGDYFCSSKWGGPCPSEPPKEPSEVYTKDFVDLSTEGAGFSTSKVRIALGPNSELIILSVYYDEDDDCIWVDVE